MKTIRRNVFETNSSSTHSICICTDEELAAWERDEILYDESREAFVTKESFLEELRADNPDNSEEELLEIWRENQWDFPKSWENWGNDFESSTHSYTTKSGDKINILCYYGYN